MLAKGVLCCCSLRLRYQPTHSDVAGYHRSLHQPHFRIHRCRRNLSIPLPDTNQRIKIVKNYIPYFSSPSCSEIEKYYYRDRSCRTCGCIFICAVATSKHGTKLRNHQLLVICDSRNNSTTMIWR